MAAAVAFMWISALHISPFVPSTNMNGSIEDGRQGLKKLEKALKKEKGKKEEKRRERERDSIHSMGKGGSATS